MGASWIETGMTGDVASLEQPGTEEKEKEHHS
jgi:hypothetical protein